MRELVRCKECEGRGIVETQPDNGTDYCPGCGGDGFFCKLCQIPSMFCDCDFDDEPESEPVILDER